ncbi:MAG TPA: hypothetical protein VE977_09965 [Pyrinomonadaceae bacterium]|nr:hypothetical protein [Pyrinomonadaceae bacterium]
MRLGTNRKARRSAFAIALLAAILFQAPLTLACGPFSLNAVFSFSVHPEYPLERFAAGEIGIVQPSYARSYLYVAYRYFKGERFDGTEQQALVALWHERLNHSWESGEEQAVKAWLDARQKVVGLGAAPKIEVFRNREKPNEYESYLNCQNDAFETAATTLEARISRFGSDSAALKQWVEAQDLVFANCSEGQNIPTDLPADSDALLRADRQYQKAAASFYSGNFSAAKTLFDSIAVDPKSPWRGTAPYLVARTLLRKASLGPDETKKEALTEAEQQLNKILANQELKLSHPASKRLQSIVRLRLHPEERLHELALSLASKHGSANLKQDLWDYTVLLDQLEGDAEAHHQKVTVKPVVLHADDLTDWVVTLQSAEAEAVNHSVAQWEATSSLPWLIAALSKVDAQNAKATALQQAAAKIPTSSPAFPSVSFHSIRLDIAAGRSADARIKLDNLLQKHRANFNASTVNLFLHQRMTVSNNLEDFLTYAQRVPAGFSWDEDGTEIPVEADELGSDSERIQGKPFFDADAGEILNRRLPVALLAEAADNKSLPDHLRRDIAQATWLRAVLLGNHATATALVPTLKLMVPEMTPFLNQYITAREPAGKQFSAIYAWLKFPGLEPVVDTGSGRGTPLNQQDSYRDNWWCSAALAEPRTSVSDEKEAGAAAAKTSINFLTATQRAAAAREYAVLASLGAAPNYLCRQVIEFATRHPEDPRVPEALHLAVKTTRYSCTDKQTGKWSKAAYDFLHQHYPGNAWTKQTPYWFKD